MPRARARRMVVDVPAVLAFLILALLATGIEVGGQVQPARIAIGFALVWLALAGAIQFSGRTLISVCLVGCVWMAWGSLSLAWTPDALAGVRELSGVALGVVTVCTVMWLLRATRGSRSLITAGWLAAVSLTLPIAAHEMITDHHLPSSYGQIESGGEESLPMVYAAVTFGNRNTYIAFLTLAFPFLLWGTASARGRFRRLLFYLVAMAAAAIILTDASRIGAALVCFETLLWIFWFIKRPMVRALAVVMLAAVVAGAVYLLPVTALRFAAALSGNDGSIDARYGLLRAGIHFLVATGGVGIGAGGFDHAVTTGLNPYATGGMTNPHNVWIQIFSQYGLLVGLAFCGWLWVCGSRLRRAIRSAENPDDRVAARAGLLLILSLPLNGVLNSAYLSFTFLWVALGCALAVCEGCSGESVQVRTALAAHPALGPT